MYLKWNHRIIYWADELHDMDRQRRKQAEFLIHQRCDWGLIQEIGVFSILAQARVQCILDRFDQKLRRPVTIRRNWYY